MDLVMYNSWDCKPKEKYRSGLNKFKTIVNISEMLCLLGNTLRHNI